MGGPEVTSKEAADLYARWGIKHRLSSAYFPQSKGRAEVAMRITKRLLQDNMAENGSLNTDNMVQSLLQQRNTPDRDCKLSPAEVLFGRGLRDAMPQLSKSVQIFESGRLYNQWHQAWAAKEEAIRSWLVRSCEQLQMGSRELPPLREGDQVFIQNQYKANGRPNKWDRQGTVIASKDHDQYLIKVHGRLTLGNRRFLRKFQIRMQFIEGHPALICSIGWPPCPPAERPHEPAQQLRQLPSLPTESTCGRPPAQQELEDLPVPRPPKGQHSNFMLHTSAAPGEREPVGILNAQCRGGVYQVNQHVGES